MLNDTIVAPVTAPGQAAVAVIRLSGPEAIAIAERFFGGSLSDKASHTVHFGTVRDGGEVVDEVLVTVFRAPNSYTGEDVAEIACHGAPWIVQKLLELCTEGGARMAGPGEFTRRAFLNGKKDLSQAEAVADLIASESAAAHRIAVNQLRGGFREQIAGLRGQLVRFASLVELELDFSGEDVEFADREELRKLLGGIHSVVRELTESFRLGNVIRTGIPVVIAGRPNTGKSTLLNALVNDERAIVSDVPGTTRDVIEERVTLGGVTYRFIDTAGIRQTKDVVESIGVERALEKMRQSTIVIYLFDVTEMTRGALEEALAALGKELVERQVTVIPTGNKCDLEDEARLKSEYRDVPGALFISAREKQNLGALELALHRATTLRPAGDVVVTNVRHYEALREAEKSLASAMQSLDDAVPGDLLAADIRAALHHLGTVTGEVTTEDLLESIFRRFCIGK